PCLRSCIRIRDRHGQRGIVPGQTYELLRGDPQPISLPTRLLDRDLPLLALATLVALLNRPHVLDAQLLHSRVVLFGDLLPKPPFDLTPDLLETANHVLTTALAFLLLRLLHRAQLLL